MAKDLRRSRLSHLPIPANCKTILSHCTLRARPPSRPFLLSREKAGQKFSTIQMLFFQVRTCRAA